MSPSFPPKTDTSPTDTRRRPPSSFTLPQVHFWKAGRIGRYVVKGPLVLGHECSGACAYVQMGVFVAKPGATVVQAGMGRENVNFPITQVCTQGLTVKGSIRYLPGSYAAAIEPISSGRVDVERLITNSFRFEEAEAAFGLFKQGKPEVFKVMISVVQD